MFTAPQSDTPRRSGKEAMTASIQSAPATLPDHIHSAARAGQDAINTSIGLWVKTWQQFPWKQFMGLSRRDPRHMPNIDQVIDTWFDIAGELLDAQRALTKVLLDVTPPGLATLVLPHQRTNYVTEQSVRRNGTDHHRRAPRTQEH
jgi:hypothetical protein